MLLLPPENKLRLVFTFETHLSDQLRYHLILKQIVNLWKVHIVPLVVQQRKGKSPTDIT